MRKRIIFLFLAVLLAVNSFCILPTQAVNTSNSLQDGDIITINSRGGHYYNYSAGANYATSYMVANLTKRADGTAVNSEKSYRAWCATYGEPTPATGDLYRLEELDGNYYDDGLGLSISLSWALSCIKAAEALGASKYPNNVWQMAIELAIRCKSDEVEVEKFDFDTMSDSGFSGSTVGEELLERQGWTVKDFYVTVQNIYNRAVANPVTYRAPVTKLEYTKTDADVVEGGQYILARYDLNVSGASVTVTKGAEYGVTATENDGTVTVSIPVSSLPQELNWVVELSYTNENASYNMFKGVPVTASGTERSDVQKIMLYDTETVVLSQPLDGSYYNPYEVGSIVVKKTDADNGAGLSGVPFEVYRVNGDSLTIEDIIVTETVGEAKTERLEIGQYLVVEGDYEGYEPFNPSTWTVTGDSGASYTTVGGKTGWLVSVSDSTSTAIIIYARNKLLPPPEEPGYIVVKKTDADTGASLSGVPFEVYKVNGESLNLTDRLVTNYAGEDSTSELSAGQYLIVEGSCEGYEPFNPSAWTVTGDSGASYTTVGGKTGWLVTIDGSTLSSITLNAKNKALPPEMPTTGGLRIEKSSYDGVREGFYFRLTDNHRVYDLIEKTNSRGLATFSNLPIEDADRELCVYYIEELGFYDEETGEYYLPGRYAPKPRIQTTLIRGETVIPVVVNNTRNVISVIVNKEAEQTDGSFAPGHGFTFRLSANIDGKEMYCDYTSNRSGECFFDALYEYDGEGNVLSSSALYAYNYEGTAPIEYTLTEIAYPDGYVPNEPIVFSCETMGRSIVFNLRNYLAKGKIELVKTAEDGVCEGFKFSVVPSLGESFTLTTDADGRAEKDGLDLYDADGELITYTVTELDVPLRYVAPEAQTKTLTAGESVVFEFYNELKKGSLRIEKDSEDGVIEGFKFSIVPSYGESFTLTTDADGRAEASELLIYAPDNTPISYQIEEIDVPLRYVAPTSVTVTLPESEDAVAQFYNELKTGSLTVYKTGQGGAPLSDVEFTLQSSTDGGVTWITESVRTTGYGGKLYFDGLEYGVMYRLVETTASEGYALQAGPVWEGLIGEGELNAEVTVRNNLITSLPFTGGNGISSLVSLSAFVALTLVGGQLMKRKKPIDIKIS